MTAHPDDVKQAHDIAKHARRATCPDSCTCIDNAILLALTAARRAGAKAMGEAMREACVKKANDVARSFTRENGSALIEHYGALEVWDSLKSLPLPGEREGEKP